MRWGGRGGQHRGCSLGDLSVAHYVEMTKLGRKFSHRRRVSMRALPRPLRTLISPSSILTVESSFSHTVPLSPLHKQIHTARQLQRQRRHRAAVRSQAHSLKASPLLKAARAEGLAGRLLEKKTLRRSPWTPQWGSEGVMEMSGCGVRGRPHRACVSVITGILCPACLSLQGYWQL